MGDGTEQEIATRIRDACFADFKDLIRRCMVGIPEAAKLPLQCLLDALDEVGPEGLGGI